MSLPSPSKFPISDLPYKTGIHIAQRAWNSLYSRIHDLCVSLDSEVYRGHGRLQLWHGCFELGEICHINATHDIGIM